IAKKFNLLVPDPQINSVAVFGLFQNIPWLPEARKGDIMILAFNEGWFWFIPFSDGRVSVGVVTDMKFYNRYIEDPIQNFFNMMVNRAGGRVCEVMKEAVSLEEMNLLQQFSKHASRKSGPGWVLVGDAAMFVDPVYSAGVLMAMTGGREVAQLTLEAFKKGEKVNATTYAPFEEKLANGYKTVLPFIYHFRKPFFQKILFHPPKEGKYVALVITVLSGCFFNSQITKDHATFWRYVSFRKFLYILVGFFTLRPLRILLKR
ncbi:MAG: tryptophan 7-halogenase, partial [Planctomycetota bacterium]